MIINPNTNKQISQIILQLATDELSPATAVQVVTAGFGASYIASRAAVAIAGHAVLNAYADAMENETNYAAVVIACFGDPGIEALREVSPVPVIGFAEAAMLAAARSPGSFAIATIGHTWSQMLAELAQRLNLSDHLAGFITLDESSRQEGVSAEKLIAAAANLGAQRIVIGGTGLIPSMPGIIRNTAFPIIDAHRTALQLALTLAAVNEPRPATTLGQVSEYVGLTLALTSLLAGGRH